MYDRLSIVSKVGFVYTLVVLIPVTAFVIVSGRQIAQEEQNDLKTLYFQAFRGSIQRLETELVTAERGTDFIALNYDILDLLSKDFELTDIIPYRENLLKLMSNIVNLTTGDLISMSLYVENPTVPESWNFVYRAEKFDAPVSLQEVYDNGYNGLWLYELIGEDTGTPSLEFIYLRPLLQYNGAPLGVIVSRVQGDSLLPGAVPLVSEGNFFFLADSNSKLLYGV